MLRSQSNGEKMNAAESFRIAFLYRNTSLKSLVSSITQYTRNSFYDVQCTRSRSFLRIFGISSTASIRSLVYNIHLQFIRSRTCTPYYSSIVLSTVSIQYRVETDGKASRNTRSTLNIFLILQTLLFFYFCTRRSNR